MGETFAQACWTKGLPSMAWLGDECDVRGIGCRRALSHVLQPEFWIEQSVHAKVCGTRDAEGENFASGG